MNPLRTILWNWQPTSAECNEIWGNFEPQVTTAFEKGSISASTALLLFTHPILLSRIVCELLWTNQQRAEAKVPTVMMNDLFRRIPDPVQIGKIETEYRALFEYAADLVERNAGYGKPPARMRGSEYLLSEALTELKSWTDARPLDGSFFEEHVLRPAEACFDGKPADTNSLLVAVARSRACCAYIVSYLLKTKGARK
jgi:hypothetical protein